MTVKRFKFNGMTNCIEYDGKSILLDSYGEDIEELLNELHEEVQLQSIVIKGYQERNDRLFKEKEQLRHEDINELSVIAMKYKALENENEQLKFENNELKCALALDEVEYIIADGKKIDIPPYYEFEQRYDSVMHRREYDGYD